MQLVARLKKRPEFRDTRVSPLLVLARAVILAMKRTPEINSYWDEAAQEVVYKHYVNLGIAAATPRGLVVPNVKDADSLSMTELAAALGQLTATARDGKTVAQQAVDRDSAMGGMVGEMSGEAVPLEVGGLRWSVPSGKSHRGRSPDTGL